MKKNKANTEIRSIGEMPILGDGRTITGYAVRFDVDSQVLTDWSEAELFIERIERGAITEELLNASDVKAYYNHNRERMLARSNKRKGSLTLFLDNMGLRYSFEAPKTVDGDTLLEQLRRGEIQGSSFAFSVGGDDVEYSRTRDGVLLRTVKKIVGLYDVSPVVDPAYTQTSVEARSWEGNEPKISPTHEEEDSCDALRRRLYLFTN